MPCKPFFYFFLLQSSQPLLGTAIEVICYLSHSIEPENSSMVYSTPVQDSYFPFIYIIWDYPKWVRSECIWLCMNENGVIARFGLLLKRRLIFILWRSWSSVDAYLFQKLSSLYIYKRSWKLMTKILMSWTAKKTLIW